MLFLFLLSYGAFCTMFVLIPTILLIPLRFDSVVRWRRRYIEFAVSYWFHFATYVSINVCGTKMIIHTSSPQIMTDKGAIVISNHRTRIDWMFAGWCYASLTNSAENLNIILKDALRSVPIFGWTMQLLMFIFLSRKRDQDIPHINNVLSYLQTNGARPSLLLFPEGSDLSESNVVKSNEFARAHGYPEMFQVLYPKPSGLLACINSLRGRGLALHDITMAYKDCVPGKMTSELSLLKGQHPKEVHMIVKRYEVDQLPTDRVELDKWLREVFAEKEALLSEWYRSEAYLNTTSSTAPASSPTSSSSSPSSTPATASASSGLQGSKMSSQWPPMLDTRTSTEIIRKSTIVVFICMLLLSLGLVFSPVVRWSCLLLVILSVVVTSGVGGGYDKIEMSWHDYYHSKQQ